MTCVVVIEHIATRSTVDSSHHPTRKAAETAAAAQLIGLGEPGDEALDAVRAAGWTAADARAYAVRIYEQNSPSEA